VLQALPNIVLHKPKDLTELTTDFNTWINSTGPAYLNLMRKI